MANASSGSAAALVHRTSARLIEMCGKNVPYQLTTLLCDAIVSVLEKKTCAADAKFSEECLRRKQHHESELKSSRFG